MIHKKWFFCAILMISLFFVACCVNPAQVINTEPHVPPTEVSYYLYFNNIVQDPQMLDCSKVYPVKRTYANEIKLFDLMQDLIKGPTEEEKLEGFVSNFPSDTVLNFVGIEGTKALIDFYRLQLGGSCATSALRAQITQTLLQLEGVNEVQIMIQGSSEEVLEP